MPIDTTRTVHVKDLQYDVQEQELFAYFSSMGQVSSVKLHRDRQTRQSLGFAFVTYYNPAHAAAAVAQLHYSTLRGQLIVVMWVGEHEALDPEANLFVRNLDDPISNEQLYELFANYGRVVSAKVMTDPATHISKGYGYVQFQYATDAQVAMQQLQGYTFGQYQLQIDVFRPKGARYSANNNNNNNSMSTTGATTMYYDPNSTNNYNTAYEEAYEDMYYHGGDYSQSGYGDEYASYYYGDNNTNNTNYNNNSINNIPDTSNTDNTKAHIVSIHVIDDGKGTLSDLSPSAKEWCPPTNTSLATTTAKVASLSSNLKPDSPVFIPGGVSNSSAIKINNSNNNIGKKKLPMNAIVTSKEPTLSTNSNNASSNSNTNSKLSPNAPVWTSASAIPTPTINTNSNTFNTSGSNTSPNIAPLLPTPIATPFSSSSNINTNNNNFNTFTTAIFSQEGSKPVNDATNFTSSPLLTSLSLPPSATTSSTSTSTSTGTSVPPLMTSSAGTPHSAISNTSTLSSSGINSLSFLDNAANTINNNNQSIFTPANSLLSFPLSAVTTSATTSTASSYTSSSTSFSTSYNNNALRLPISPSSPTNFPFSVTGASYANLTSTAAVLPAVSPSHKNTLHANKDNINTNDNDPMQFNDYLPPMVSSSPFPFHFALSISTSTKSISSPETLIHNHDNINHNLPSDINIINNSATATHLPTHAGIFPLTPSSPFPLSSLVQQGAAPGVITEEDNSNSTLPFTSHWSVSTLQQQLQLLLRSQHRVVSHYKPPASNQQKVETIDPWEQLFFTVTFLQSLPFSTATTASQSSSLFGDESYPVLLEGNFSALNTLPTTSFLPQSTIDNSITHNNNTINTVKDNKLLDRLLNTLTPEAVPLLDNMVAHLQMFTEMCETRRSQLLHETTVSSSKPNIDNKNMDFLAIAKTNLHSSLSVTEKL